MAIGNLGPRGQWASDKWAGDIGTAPEGEGRDGCWFRFINSAPLPHLRQHRRRGIGNPQVASMLYGVANIRLWARWLVGFCASDRRRALLWLGMLGWQEATRGGASGGDR